MTTTKVKKERRGREGEANKEEKTTKENKERRGRG